MYGPAGTEPDLAASNVLKFEGLKFFPINYFLDTVARRVTVSFVEVGAPSWLVSDCSLSARR